ncbi:MAG: 50S ribosomal protein L25/general stress protein Ctc [Gammaproteobacteria bacterium]|nr:MAG: 50S ribosomal protein L25/general stress protein Ctc [Gammaproteobacteria bacterium]
MATTFELNAETRSDLGKGASRRLRHAGKVPAVIYGAGKDSASLTLEHNEVFHALENEAFYSSILTVNIDGKAEKAVLKDLQRHPARPIIMHMDLQRVEENARLHMHVPIHFIGEDIAPGVKAGGVVNHAMTEVEVTCLPKDLPEYIEVDISALEVDQILHLSDLQTPEGVEMVELGHGSGHNQPVVSIHLPRGTHDEDEEEEAAEEAAPAEEARAEGDESES